MRRLFALVAIVFAAAGCSSGESDRVIIAAGTTLVDSGFLQAVVDSYPRGSDDVRLSIVGVGSAEAVAYAEAGTADVIITHERGVLADYLERAPAATSSPVFASEFVVLAPPSGSIAGRSARDVFSALASTDAAFVSRDDRSGTHVRELDLWDTVGFDPSGEAWYIRSGAGMGATILVADQKRAYTLAELGAFLATRDGIELTQLDLAADGLENPYDLTVVDPVGDTDAAAFAEWLLSEDGRGAIRAANETLFGRQVYRVP